MAGTPPSRGRPDRLQPRPPRTRLGQPLRTLSGGQRRRVELARILFSGAETLLLDEPTNHLDADSIVWLREFLKAYRGGLVVISHDVGLLELTSTGCSTSTPTGPRSTSTTWAGGTTSPSARPTSGGASASANAEKKADALMDQAHRMRAKATKAQAAQSMMKRAERLLSGLEAERSRQGGRLRFPAPAPCGKTPLTAEGLSKSYGSLEVFTDVDLAIDRGSRVVILGLNGAGKTTLLRILAGSTSPTPARSCPARAQARLLRAGARDPRPGADGAREHAGRRART